MVDTSSNFGLLETCFDGVWNQGERGMDCGGPCPPGGILNLMNLLHPNHICLNQNIRLKMFSSKRFTLIFTQHTSMTS